jgi:hypothetical protein
MAAAGPGATETLPDRGAVCCLSRANSAGCQRFLGKLRAMGYVGPTLIKTEFLQKR